MNTSPLRLALATLTAATLVVAGCSSNAQDEATQDGASPGETATAAETKTIGYSYWGSGERVERTEAVIDLFEEAHPDIKIESTPREFGTHWEQLTIQGSAQGAPCVPQMQNRYMGDYSSRDQLRPLDDLVEAGKINLDGIPEAFLATGRGNDGKLYNAITGVYFYVQMYNEDMIEEAGVPEPTNDMTWEEWEAWLRDLSANLPEDIPAADLYPATDFSGSFFNYVYSHGQEVFTDEGNLGFDEQILAEWFTLWDELRKDGVTTTAEDLGERDPSTEQLPLGRGLVAWNSQPHNQLAQMQNVASTNDLGTMRIVKLPNGPSGAGETFGSNGLSISTSCDEDSVDAAAQFIDFFVNDPEAAMAYGSSNGAVSKDELQTAQIEDPNTDESLRAGLELLQTVVNDFDPKGFVFPAGGRAISDSFTRAATSVFLEQATAEQAAQQFISEANGMLQQG